MGTILDAVPTWVVMLGIAILIVAISELGFHVGRMDRKPRGSEGPSAVMQAAAFTLLGLLLAFAFSLALGRYDARRATLVREANAIGTTLLRTKLLDERTASAMRGDLRQYVAERLDFARSDANPRDRSIAAKKSTLLQHDMWRLATEAARRDPRSTTIPLFVSALNETIDLSTEEDAVLEAHIPDIVIGGLVLIVLISAGMMGHSFGRQNQRALVSKILYALTIAIAIGLVLDLDRPQRGLIRVNLQPLQTLQQSLPTGEHRK